MKPIVTAALAAALLVAPATTNAQETEGCETVDYQGAPLEMCPPQEPDPTNCYTGDYQGAPIEICMPTGWQPDPSWTYQGEPIVMHVSKDYVAPEPAPAPVAQPPAPVVQEQPDELIAFVLGTLALLGYQPASGPYVPAERGEQIQLWEPPPPPPTGLYGLPFAPEGLDDCAEMRFYLDQFGMPARFDGIGWRESNCRNEDSVRTSCCHGYLQLNANLHVRDHRLNKPYAECGVFGNEDINSDDPLDKQRHACAASKLYGLLGYQPWS